MTTEVSDPVLVVEVLTAQNAIERLTRRWLAWRKVPSLRVVLWPETDERRVHVRRRGEGGWRDEEPAEGRGGVVALPELGIELPLEAIYEGVPLEEE